MILFTKDQENDMSIQSPTIATESSRKGEEEEEEEEENMFLVEGVSRKQKAFLNGPLSCDQVSEQINNSKRCLLMLSWCALPDQQSN